MTQTTTTPPAALHGIALLQDPRRNRSTGFAQEERAQLGLLGLLRAMPGQRPATIKLSHTRRRRNQ